MRPSQILAITCALFTVLISTGCQTYETKSNSRATAWATGDIDNSLKIAASAAQKNQRGKDAILYQLEYAAVTRTAALETIGDPTPPSPAQLKQAIHTFDRAEQLMAESDQKANIRLSTNLASTFTNQDNIPYTGRDYDRIMASTYKTLDYLQLGDKAAARVELNRSLRNQRESVQNNANKIIKEQEAAAASNANYDLEAAQNTQRVAQLNSEVTLELQKRIRPNADYVNPFAVLLDGLFFLHNAANNSDLERARKSFQRLCAIEPSNQSARHDLAAAEQGRPQKNLTYVIFETGQAPVRVEERIDLPVFIFTEDLSYIGASLPELVFNDNFEPQARIHANGQTHTTEFVASMDSIIAQAFQNEWPSILTRTLIAAAAKASADMSAQRYLQKNTNETIQLIGLIASNLTQKAINIADTRTWQTLPKEFHYCRFDTPQNGPLQIQVGQQTLEIQPIPDTANVIYIKSIRRGAPLHFSHFTL